MKEYKKYIQSRSIGSSISAISQNDEGDIYLFITSRDNKGLPNIRRNSFIKLNSQYEVLGIWELQYDIEVGTYIKYFIDNDNTINILSTRYAGYGAPEKARIYKIIE